MPPLSPSMLLATAGSYVGLGAEQVCDRHLLSDVFLRGVGAIPTAPWAAAFVHHVGHWSHYRYGGHYSSWPLPATANCADLGRFAREHAILVEDPAPGDVFLMVGRARPDFVHAGIVVVPLTLGGPRWADRRCTTIEGDVDAKGSAGGRQVRLMDRALSVERGDRFVRWVDLDGRSVIARPTVDSTIHMGRLIVTKAA